MARQMKYYQCVFRCKKSTTYQNLTLNSVLEKTHENQIDKYLCGCFFIPHSCCQKHKTPLIILDKPPEMHSFDSCSLSSVNFVYCFTFFALFCVKFHLFLANMRQQCPSIALTDGPRLFSLLFQKIDCTLRSKYLENNQLLKTTPPTNNAIKLTTFKTNKNKYNNIICMSFKNT